MMGDHFNWQIEFANMKQHIAWFTNNIFKMHQEKRLDVLNLEQIQFARDVTLQLYENKAWRDEKQRLRKLKEAEDAANTFETVQGRKRGRVDSPIATVQTTNRYTCLLLDDLLDQGCPTWRALLSKARRRRQHVPPQSRPDEDPPSIARLVKQLAGLVTSQSDATDREVTVRARRSGSEPACSPAAECRRIYRVDVLLPDHAFFAAAALSSGGIPDRRLEPPHNG